jgi:hypothetical protein
MEEQMAITTLLAAIYMAAQFSGTAFGDSVNSPYVAG